MACVNDKWLGEMACQKEKWLGETAKWLGKNEK